MPTGTDVGKLYGSCKVHKTGYPVRPIVAMINTPEYNLAKYLDAIIKPYIPMKHAITSNVEFLQKLNDYEIMADDRCISFDAVSLFTNVPLQFTINLIADELYCENNTNKPPMSKASLVELLKCATGGMFSHRGQLWQQKDGVSMGNPLAPTMANFFLGVLEREMFQHKPEETDPVFYTRYVDDVFCVLRKGVDFQPFLKKLNSLHSNLAFTFEIGGNSLPFLDTNVDISGTEVSSTIYRKKTDTGVILNYSSMAPREWKSALIKWFLKRADRICTNDKLFYDEVNHLRQMFHNNGYPEWFFEQEYGKFTRNGNCMKNEAKKQSETCEEENNKLNQRNVLEDNNGKKNDGEKFDEKKRPEEQQHEKRIWLKVPYIGRPSLLFRKRIKNLFEGVCDNLKVVFSTTKVHDYFVTKDRTPKPLLSNVVYQFTCLRDSSIQYIGFTNRSLKVRAHEHLRTGTTAISDHLTVCTKCENGATLESFKILKQCRNDQDTRIFEALLIKKINPVLNLSLKKPGWTWTLKVFG